MLYIVFFRLGITFSEIHHGAVYTNDHSFLLHVTTGTDLDKYSDGLPFLQMLDIQVASRFGLVTNIGFVNIPMNVFAWTYFFMLSRLVEWQS